MAENHKWNENGDHLVLFMDIMGFKDRVTRMEHQDLLNKMIEFKEKNDRLKPLLQDKNGELLRMVQFSDSIIIASLDDSKSALNRIVKAGVVLMQNALETGFALKGAITKGPLTFDSELGIYFGLPLVDAYLLEEELKFYGVAFHHSVEELIQQYKERPLIRGGREQYLPVSEYQIHLKSGRSLHFCILYHKLTRLLAKGDYSVTLNRHLKLFSRTVSGSPKIYIDNTRNFLEDAHD
ncbi:hypothetical protein [Alistipes shahii]|uniref:hypothetical protein n=1 Tax=Alistipes shahii TaxID=328814 RepID=UPI0027D3C7A4|nr:hypothetical protein [Bacteroides sp.]MBQ4589452.1 hypothetical protein [Bacteroidaceae bacterium]